MGRMRCPGQDPRYWKPGDIYQVPCAHCGRPIEFFKDDRRRRCSHCRKYTVNPKHDLSCSAWCKFGAECVGQAARLGSPGDDADKEEGVATE